MVYSDSELQRMLEIYEAEKERSEIAKKLRDAFRVIAWQHFQPHLKETELSDCYTQFNSRWCRHRIHSMDYYELAGYTIEKGFSISQLLLMREIYYGIHF